MNTKCGCYVKYEGQDHWHRPIENGISFCPMHAAAPEMLEVLTVEHDALTDHFQSCEKDCETCALIKKIHGRE